MLGRRGKIQRLVLLLKGALNARDKVGLKMNLEEYKLKDLLDKAPGAAKSDGRSARPAGLGRHRNRDRREGRP